MRILQLIQKPQLRGAEIFACQLSNHLIAAGHEVKMICLLDGNVRLPFSGDVIKLNRPLSKRMFDVFGWRMLAKEIVSFNPDVVQANAGDTLKFAVNSKSFFGWKAPIIFRNANKISEFIDSQPKYWLNKFFVSRTSRVISVSELCRLDFIQTLKYPTSHIDTVQIGIDMKLIGSIPTDLEKIFKSGPVLVNVGSLVKEKNHEGLLRIFSKVRSQIANAQLIIVGKGHLLSPLELMVKQTGLESHVHFLGYRNDVLEIIHAADAFLLPSLIEGLPGVILEAQYSKTPVIAYNVGGISEIVQNNSTGWLIEKDNEESFVESVFDVLKGDSSSREQMVEKAYKQVVDHFDNKVIAERFIKVYQTLTGVRL